MAEMIEIEILRYRPEQDNEPWMQTFQVPYLKEMSLWMRCSTSRISWTPP